ncbi:MAG TPA: phosphoribosylaminoimidazolesuccinocarboxamide synthase, partial [Candidatus Dormibacteraeota bacterium]|nr:phosphoribosylaminoimidazolesuccinocarboxamide synthase [Candidatus Dormibacteraeota bacterium]
MIAGPALNATELPLKLFAKGKVRDTYELDDGRLLMVATDRLSAFDHVLPNGIPDRGKVLTQLSIFWFSQTDTFQANHLISGMIPDLPAVLKSFREELAGRFMIVRKAKRIDFECVVRGYLAGSAWKEYEESQTLAGEKMPPGLRQSEKLAYPTFSPATKAESGHDENITFDQMKKELGDELATKLRDASLELYKYASDFAGRRGLILADTKFEFGT